MTLRPSAHCTAGGIKVCKGARSEATTGTWTQRSLNDSTLDLLVVRRRRLRSANGKVDVAADRGNKDDCSDGNESKFDARRNELCGDTEHEEPDRKEDADDRVV